MSSSFPLAQGSSGNAVLDLQRRLQTHGAFVDADFSEGVYCSNTVRAIEQFQQQRGLPITGVCDHLTWSILVESSWALGSRLLYLTSPHMRGDDVQTMQTVLAKLGFDCGRADGIFGPNTLRALTEFQQNYGITADGICGVNTIRALERTRSQSGEGPGIVTVREFENLLNSGDQSSRPRIVVGCFGAHTQLTRLLVRELRAQGDDVVTVENADHRTHSRTANSFESSLYIGVASMPDPGVLFAYYKTGSFTSAGGKLAAELCDETVRRSVSRVATETRGMQLPVLRETRMPAVLCSLGAELDPTSIIQLATPLAEAINQWCDRPIS